MLMGLIDKIKARIKLKRMLRLQGKSSFSESVGHAIDGINYTVSRERNFKIEIGIALIVSVMGFVLKVSSMEWAILVLTIAMVLALEMVNTAIERCVDLVTKDYRELAKVAKDVSAGAVLVMSLFSVVIGIVVFLPKFIVFIK